ncbi:hypothetical protein F889_03489 [Acinetobacter colistiniresistens]|uniref:Beta-barrel assembly machine subunit BamE n=1 Tax=Acinetobacter colistiniresistens TaxID=280145 RepID=N9R034_9GAMM|nr:MULTISPECIES: hypothetical protein [Acinetobacter]ENX17113.1 hypothetical protein F895_01048 [Acinetobacter sp. CIP 64.2]ENX32507.1 hypothetical protein F889_03489 [Acinetobacter colistiniresistens]EPG35917.1 hypothetical protein F907_02789 [Acinetobacter colistiniresistens]TVT83182.1 hypothetical protein FPV60_07945 [Acinetobacter colistiniresistens]UUM27703.1 hypothetical protein NQU59_00650 [Acinetobacter colistiniresistens]
MKKTYVALGLVIVLSLQGCAAVMASNQPHKKNLSVLEVGKHRNNVISELGAPVTSEIQNGERKEIYTFQQGYSKGARISRTLWHTTADIATIGLWEIIGSPTEIYFNGQQLSYEVVFDDRDNIKSAKLIQNAATPVVE